MRPPETICVVGLGHLGSVVAACWAELGHRVIGLDGDAGVVERLRTGRAPIFEPGLDALLRSNASNGRLAFTTDVREAVGGADVAFVALDTPVDANDRLDLAPVEGVVRSVAPYLHETAVVIVSSQVPVGTCDRWRQEVRRLSAHEDIDVAYAPENLRLGDAIRSYRRPERIVVGADADATCQRVVSLFAPLNAPVLTMSSRSAEMTKHALNSFLATSVSFINEIASLCEASGADVLSVIDALKTDPRIGPRAFLSPGLGFAGGTLARDVQVLREIGRARRIETLLLDNVLEVNRRRPDLVLQRLRDACGRIEGLVVGVLGLTYKAGTSTLRRSVALEVIRVLAEAGAKVRAYDPRADLSELKEPVAFEIVRDAYEAATAASALLILTEWPEFAQLDFDRVKSAMTHPVILDENNLLAGLRLGERGFQYMGVGR